MANKYTSIDTSAINFSEVKTIPMINGNNRKTVYINYSNGKFVFETPELKFPFGLYEDATKDSSGNITGCKYSLTTSMGDNAKFNELMNEVSKLVMEECTKNSKTWLGQNYKAAEIKVLYNDHVKKYKDRDTGEETGKYPDTFRVKLPYYDNKFACKIFDNKKNLLSDDEIKSKLIKGTVGKMLIQCNGVYFASGKFGISWKVIQAKITPVKDMSEYALMSSSDEDDDNSDTD